jgi:hypothetical protein
VDWFIVLGPVLVLPLILLFGFVGCGQQDSPETGLPMLKLWFLPQALDTTPPQGGSVLVTFPPVTPGPLQNSWTRNEDLSTWRPVQTLLPTAYTQEIDGQALVQGQIQCVVTYYLPKPKNTAPDTEGSQTVWLPTQSDVVFYLDARNLSPAQWLVSGDAPPGAPQPPQPGPGL